MASASVSGPQRTPALRQEGEIPPADIGADSFDNTTDTARAYLIVPATALTPLLGVLGPGTCPPGCAGQAAGQTGWVPGLGVAGEGPRGRHAGPRAHASAQRCWGGQAGTSLPRQLGRKRRRS